MTPRIPASGRRGPMPPGCVVGGLSNLQTILQPLSILRGRPANTHALGRDLIVVALCTIAILTLVDCSRSRATQGALTHIAGLRLPHASPAHLRQPSTAVDVVTKKGLWYFQHPKERASALMLCDRDFQRFPDSKTFEKRHPNCDNVVQVQALAYERDSHLRRNTRAECASFRYQRTFHSECRAVFLADQLEKLFPHDNR